MTNTPLADLLAFQKDTEALGQVAGRLGWDQETVMPRGAAEQRAEEMAAMEQVLHARRTDPRVGDWLAACEGSEMTEADTAKLRHIRRSFDRASKLPAALSAEIARVTSVAQGQWAEARAKDDFAAFAPVLARVIELRQQEAQALSQGGDLYDALADDYEPGATAAELGAMFDEMRPRLVELRGKVLEKPAPAGLKGSFPDAEQMAFASRLALAFGYDLNRGRIDKAVHPFSSGSGNDVRITTRTNPEDPFNCFYSTIHEVGHACYEQNIDQGYLLTSLGQGVSMGVHESQSRIYENQLGRSRAFTGWIYEQMREAFGDIGVDSPEAFYAAVNRVQKDFIRTEADELQYNLHIMLRFDLERALISGDLKAADLEAAWNERFEADFGYAVPRASLGCLQDVHWSLGLFGYFPTYSLGNVYAGCLAQAMRKDLPDLDAALAKGETSSATSWLGEKVQRHGGLYEPKEVITRACGEAPSAGPLLDYIETKFSDLYGL
ncbi:carboxypeptidase Taq [Pseudooceanicola antarcticus]|uniref:Metal-dependent carboxypeptidase n=1 Tax=Pseudooceanicola antarcticus TaxID=1247613 RepID=A0A285IX51_9RHOB|nr:carboxypeptidase M32 [Pseudooceanicola antarcticus]PJE25860.1 carboxypeptidase M32 [Pseudooceanicola antarcticus]SNY52574.1 carboxypeptidase Taq [Pseudooceanicola antarcticus]